MKTIKLLTFPLFLFLLSLNTSCIDDIFVEGNGMPGSEGRITKPFTEIASSGDYVVHVTHGNKYEVLLYAETNLLPYIETNVRGNTLHIETSGIHSLRNSLPVEVYITTPVLEGLALSGSGTITTDSFVTDQISIALSGSGKIETKIDAFNSKTVISGSGQLLLSGISDNADFVISGSGKIKASDLLVGDCSANISGSGEMRINVEKFLLVNISGSGNVLCWGRPLVESHISGSGKLITQN